MAQLRPCTEIWGAATIIDSDPAEEILHRVIYNPFSPTLWLDDPNWGLYREDGSLIDAAAYYRLPEKFLVGQSERVVIPPDLVHAPGADYAYVGPVILHYGHFITAFLPRLWQLVRGGLSADTLLVCHSDTAPEDWFTRDYVRTILGELGLSPDRFVRPGRVTRFPRLRVPRPAMVEQAFAHRVFRDLGLFIGSRIRAEPGRSGLVYLSKTLLRHGTYRIGNEAAIDDLMSDRGVRVVRPETLSLAQQIGILSNSSAVIGTIGSGFHTSLFCQEPCRVLGLAYENKINANYPLLDKLTSAKATYVHLEQGLTAKPLLGVTFGYWLDDPAAVVDELLQLI
jgi:capsular polysaccharide biosynthesis protein